MKVAAITPHRKFDYLADLVLEGLRLGGHEVLATDIGNGVTEALDDRKFTQAALTADVVLAFFGKVRSRSQPSPKHHLLNQPQLSRLPRDRIAYIDGSELTYTALGLPNQTRESLRDPRLRRGEPWLNEAMRKRCGFYFKRETYPQDLERGVIPLLFGLSPKRHLLPGREKDIDLSCIFGHTMSGLRPELVQACQRLAKERPDRKIVVETRVPKARYEEVLLRSKIVVDAWGFGDCCDRFWEAIGAKACCLYQRYNIVFPEPFEDWVQAVSFATMREFHERANALLDDLDRAKRIGLEGFDHGLRRHCAQARVEQIWAAMGLTP